MKRLILFSLVGAIIIFIWQFLSNAYPNFHKDSIEYTNKQDTILNKIKEIDLSEGRYLLGQGDPSLPQDQQMKMHESYANKPWAILSYHKKNEMDMVKPIIRSIMNGFVISFLLGWIILQIKNPTLKNRIIISILVGLISFFFVPYSSFIWYKDPGIFAFFADGIVPWIILGMISNKMFKQI